MVCIPFSTNIVYRSDSLSSHIACPLFTDPTPECWERSFHADVLGLITLIEATVPYLEKRATDAKTTSIIVISSLHGFETHFPGVGSPYTTFKRAQATIAKDFARQLAPKGIRINTIIPGAIENPNITKPDGTVEWSNFQILKRDNYHLFKSMLDATPIGRTGKPEEIASAVLFLSSGLADYITGSKLVIDGGVSTSL